MPRRTTEQLIEFLNSRLAVFGQSNRITYLNQKSVTFSIGGTFKDAQKQKWVGCITRENTAWIENFDKLLSGSITKEEVMAPLWRAQGSRSWEDNSDNIRKNLNTGTPWNRGTTGLQTSWNKGLTKDTHQSLKNLSVARTGNGNTCHRQTLKSRASIKDNLSKVMKQKILDGTFTPNTKNSRTHWTAELDGQSYRSSWEALFRFHNPDLEYESLRISYEMGIYIVDFIDRESKVVYEIKPLEHRIGCKYESKMQSLEEWAETNKYRVVLVGLDDLMQLYEPSIDQYTRFNESTARKIKETYAAYQKKRNQQTI